MKALYRLIQYKVRHIGSAPRELNWIQCILQCLYMTAAGCKVLLWEPPVRLWCSEERLFDWVGCPPSPACFWRGLSEMVTIIYMEEIHVAMFTATGHLGWLLPGSFSHRNTGWGCCKGVYCGQWYMTWCYDLGLPGRKCLWVCVVTAGLTRAHWLLNVQASASARGQSVWLWARWGCPGFLHTDSTTRFSKSMGNRWFMKILGPFTN